MFTNLKFFKGKIYKFKVALVLVVLLFVTGAHGNPIIKNDLEDLNILISQFVGGEPNILTILDLSGSMGRNNAGTQLGNWDDSTIQDCERAFGTSNNGSRTRSAHCAENAANLTVCGSLNCERGTCDLQNEFNSQVTCVQTKAPALNMGPIFQTVCGGTSASTCDTPDERANAAAAIEARAGLTQCSVASNCKLGSDTNPACDTSSDYTKFKTCMQTSQTITINQTGNCTGGDSTCDGQPRFGSSRIDMAQNVFFSLLDADNSLNTKKCDDPNKLFDGTNNSISCKDYMETPFRDVNVHVKGTGSGFRLPITGASDTALIDELTDEDAEILGIRIRPMSYSGAAKWAGCTAGNTFQAPQGGFAGASKADLDGIWKFYRSIGADGGTPLAYALGLDDSDKSNSTIPNDALGVYRVELQTDPAISCRPEFVVVITDGEDTCSGQCSVTSDSCNGNVTTNANRRSSIQAVSNLRTYNVRNPVKNRGDNYKKEILTFVIGIGIEQPEARRLLNAMALAGGTHTTGVIKHTDPDGKILGTVDIDDVLPGGSEFNPFRVLATAAGIDSDPAGATLRDCKTPIEDAANTAPNTGIHCHIGNGDQSLFYNAFFNTGNPFTSAKPLENFAFFANNAEELAAALETIFNFVDTFSSTGVSPAAPQSSTSVALRDRIFLSIFTPITEKRLWQGRLALYGFKDDPDNPGAKLIVDKDGDSIFDPVKGTLDEDAENFHWEAGKALAEIDVDDLSTSRRLFTLDPDSFVTDPNSQIRYTGDQIGFDPANFTPEDFGITDLDVTVPIPDFCTADPPDGIDDCSSVCTVIAATACRNCVKTCIKDKIVSFMTGDTEIQPKEDPMGTIGVDCPDPETSSGSLDACAVRLGAILNSTPRVVGSPSPLFFDVGFQNFAAEFRDRSAAVYIGANDGFIHSFHAGELETAGLPKDNPFTGLEETVPFFNEGTGKELFGFAPPSFLPSSLTVPAPLIGDAPSGLAPDYRFGDFKSFVLTSLQPARSFSDGSPLVADVWIDGKTNGIAADDTICPGESGTGVGDPDGEIDLCGREWHTVLLTGPRNGGGAYTALNVTNVKCTDNQCTGIGKQKSDGPEYPEHMWTIFDTNFGNAWSEPTIGRVRLKTQDAVAGEIIVDRWVMFIGGGLDPTDIDPLNGITFGNAFYVVDIPTGKIIFKFHPNTSGLLNVDKMVCDMPAKVGAFDLNADGYIDLAYAGDTCGRLWRFDVSMPIETTASIDQTGSDGSVTFSAPDWTGDVAFCATDSLAKCNNPARIQPTERQPIFFAPTTVLDDLGRRHVIFVTGNRRFPSTVLEYGKLYNFVDGFIPAFLAGGSAVNVPADPKTEADFDSGQVVDLVPQTGPGISDQFTTSGGTTINNQGEFIVHFPDNVETLNGEKAFGSPVVISRVLVFATFAPDPQLVIDPCSGATGVGRVFGLDYLSGEPALARIPGAQDLIQGGDKSLAAGRKLAEGMPTPAQLTYGARGSVVLTMAFSGGPALGGAQFLVWPLPPFPARTQTLFWEEIL